MARPASPALKSRQAPTADLQLLILQCIAFKSLGSGQYWNTEPRVVQCRVWIAPKDRMPSTQLLTICIRAPAACMQEAAGRSNGDGDPPVPWVWVGSEAALIRGLFRALNGYCIAEVPRGWAALHRTACYLR